ncbi:MAG: hypothetical protein ACP5OP_06130, partial [Leptospirillia bacterium]
MTVERRVGITAHKRTHPQIAEEASSIPFFNVPLVSAGLYMNSPATKLTLSWGFLLSRADIPLSP